LTISETRRRWRRLALATLLALVAIGLGASTARAQTPAEKQEALGLLREGNRLFDAGDYAGALSRYQRAYAQVPNPKMLFNIGQAERALGRSVDALGAYERFLAEARDAPTALRAEAERHRADLEKATATIEVVAERAGVPAAGAQVSVDGAAYGATPLDRPVRVMPGAHQVVVEPGGGAPPLVVRVAVAPGGRATARAQLPVEPVRAAARPLSEPSAASPPTGVRAEKQPEIAATPAPGGSASHRRRFGVTARADLDWRLEGAGAAVALTFSVTEQFEVAAGAFHWPASDNPINGASLGGTLYLSARRLRPFLAADAQLYDYNKGLQGAGRAAFGVAWDVTGHLALFAAAGVEHVFGSLPIVAPKTFPVPALGVTGRI
jgi:tetratricopeptide (TPR) repeat protein